MKITKKELKRIAQICFLNFSDSDLKRLQLDLESAYNSDEVIYLSEKNNIEKPETCVFEHYFYKDN